MSTRAVAMARWSYRFLWRRSEYVAPLGNQGTGGQTLHQRQLGYGFLMADGSSLPSVISDCSRLPTLWG